MRSKEKFKLVFTLYGENFVKYFETKERAEFFERCIKSHAIYTKPISITSAFALYLGTESIKKSKSSQSKDKTILTKLEEFLEHEDLKALVEVRLIHLEKYQNILSEKMKGSSVNRCFNTVKHCFKKLNEWEYIITSPAAHIRSLQTDETQVPLWSEEDFRHLYSLVKDPSDLLKLEILWQTGARGSSVLNLRKSDVNFDLLYISFQSQKGPYRKAKRYKVPINKHLAKSIENHLDPGKDKLFKISVGTFNKRILRLLKNSKLAPKKLTIHGIRHTFATGLYNKKVHIDQIATLLGHSNSKVTEKYILKDLENLRYILQD